MLPRVVVATLRALESEENILTDYKIIGNEKGDTIIVLSFPRYLIRQRGRGREMESEGKVCMGIGKRSDIGWSDAIRKKFQ